jgi:hypothetical protein
MDGAGDSLAERPPLDAGVDTIGIVILVVVVFEVKSFSAKKKDPGSPELRDCRWIRKKGLKREGRFATTLDEGYS